MNDFSARVAEWSSFYSTLGGVSATMAGLLFASLTFNSHLLDNPHLRRIAQQAFTNFSTILVISLTMLQPRLTRWTLAAALGGIGILTIVRLVKQLLSMRKERQPAWTTRSHKTALGSYLLLVATAYMALGAPAEVLYLLVGVVLTLLIGSGRLCWELLLHRGEDTEHA